MSAPPTPAQTTISLLERLHRFADELRSRGLPVSMVERIDAMQAVEGLPLDRPHDLHAALSATLIKASEHLSVFDEVFQLFFRMAQPNTPLSSVENVVASRTDEDPSPPDRPTPLDLDHALRAVLRDGSEVLARLVAEQAVAQFARFEAGRAVAGVQYEMRTVTGLNLQKVSGEVLREGQDGSGASGGPTAARQLGFELQSHLVADRTEAVRQQIREVIRELLVADRGVEAVAKTLRTPLPTDVVISMANQAQLAEIERVMKPLQRKLATTMMRKRRKRNGPLDVRATLRVSMATGGVPVRVIHRRPAPTKPQLFVLADVSGSVSTFAAFTVTLVSAMSQLFSRLRTFAFVENAVDVTELFREHNDPLTAVKAINTMNGLNFLDARTDYGRSLRQFWNEVGPQLGRRSTVLIFGDARGNYRPSEEATLVHIAKKAGAVYWLNPESERDWGSGDSLMDVYARHCTKAVACRTLADLRRFVENLD